MANPTPSTRRVTGWQPVHPRYRWLLRAYVAVYHALLAAALAVAQAWVPGGVPWPGPPMLGVATVLSFLFFFTVWSVRRARLLRYRVRPLDVSLKRGYVFWKQMSMPLNRVQHLEVNQGPLQRAFGLATLNVYSAGTHGSDLRIPGMGLSAAHRLKERLLASINTDAPEPSDAD